MTGRETEPVQVTRVRSDIRKETEPLARVCQKQSGKGFSQCPSLASPEAEADMGLRASHPLREAPGRNLYSQGNVVEKGRGLSRDGVLGKA